MKQKLKLFLLNLIRFFSGKKIIVSLTSYPARYDNLHLVVKSLLRQKLRPDRINLYLYEGESGDLPERLTLLQSRRFRIIKVKDNIRPHKKYFYAFKDYPNDLVITVDDDFMYPDDLVLNLYRIHLKYRKAVVCGRCRRIRFDKEGGLLPYNAWPLSSLDDEPHMSLLATGVGGVLYVPKLLDPRVLELDALKELALNQDDLWLKIMEALAGVKTIQATIRWPQGKDLGYESSLFSVNEQGENDKCLRRLMEYFGLSDSIFKD